MFRIAFYSHDTYGLGHLIRSLKLADAMAARLTPVEGRIITGSPWADLFPVPPDHDVVRLPEVVKRGSDLYEPREADRSFSEVLSERRGRILEAVRAFDPDLMVVDNVPCGLAGEVLPALRWLVTKGRGRAVLALRDIIDEGAAVRAQWERMGALEAMSDLYEEIWVFGLPEVNDVARTYGLPARVAKKVYFCGYLGPRSRTCGGRAGTLGGADIAREQDGWPEPSGERRPPTRGEDRPPSVVLTAGGGGDALPLVSAFLSMLRCLQPPLRSRIVLGPDFPLSELEPDWEHRPGVHEILTFVRDLPREIAASSVTVSMVGYNTFSEILALGARAVLVPRVFPRREQWLRALAFRGRAGTWILHPNELSPQSLWEAIRGVMHSPRPEPVSANGGASAAARAATLIGSAASLL